MTRYTWKPTNEFLSRRISNDVFWRDDFYWKFVVHNTKIYCILLYEHSYYKYLELWGNFHSGPLFQIYIKKYLSDTLDSKCAKSSNVWGTQEKFFCCVWTIPCFCRHLCSEKIHFNFDGISTMVSNYSTSIGGWFSKNRQKLLSAIAISFLRVGWCCKLYQQFPWILRMLFHIHKVLVKWLEQILQ